MWHKRVFIKHLSLNCAFNESKLGEASVVWDKARTWLQEWLFKWVFRVHHVMNTGIKYTQKLKYSVQYYLIWIINYWFLWHFSGCGCFKIFSECISYIFFHPMLWRILYLFMQPIGVFATDGHVMHFSRTHWFRHW